MLTRLIPKIFYANMEEGLDLFVGALRFNILHRDATLAVVERENAKAYIVEDAAFAAKDRPEIALETDAIDALFDDLSATRPELLHPNLKRVTLRPWGAREFALLDATGVCVLLREWPH